MDTSIHTIDMSLTSIHVTNTLGRYQPDTGYTITHALPIDQSHMQHSMMLSVGLTLVRYAAVNNAIQNYSDIVQSVM